MAQSAGSRTELKGAGYEIFMGILSILSILNIVLIYATEDQNLDTVIGTINGLLSVVFLGDFLYRLFTAESKSVYFVRQFGWADLLTSLPFPQAKVLRLFRLTRVIRSAPCLGCQADRWWAPSGSSRKCVAHPVADGHPRARVRKPRNPLHRTVRIRLEHPVGLGCAVVRHRHHLHGRLRRSLPGDRSGRLLGALIIVVGVGIFGTFTGYLANLFLAPPSASDHAEQPPSDALARVAQLKALMAEQQASIDEIEDLLRADG